MDIDVFRDEDLSLDRKASDEEPVVRLSVKLSKEIRQEGENTTEKKETQPDEAEEPFGRPQLENQMTALAFLKTAEYAFAPPLSCLSKNQKRKANSDSPLLDVQVQTTDKHTSVILMNKSSVDLSFRLSTKVFGKVLRSGKRCQLKLNEGSYHDEIPIHYTVCGQRKEFIVPIGSTLPFLGRELLFYDRDLNEDQVPPNTIRISNATLSDVKWALRSDKDHLKFNQVGGYLQAGMSFDVSYSFSQIWGKISSKTIISYYPIGSSYLKSELLLPNLECRSSGIFLLLG